MTESKLTPTELSPTGPSTTVTASAGNTPINNETSFERWNRKLRMTTGLGLKSSEEKQEWLLSRCRGWKDDLVETSPVIRYLLQHISTLPVPDSQPSSSEASRPTRSIPIPINCGICSPMRSAGLFSPNEPDPSSPTGGQVKLCADSLASKAHLEDVLSHELIHAYDHRRFDIDWTNLRHIACTEIRANALSGDCKWTREVDRHNFNFARQRQICARRRAILSVAQHISAGSQPSGSGDQATSSKTLASEQAEKVVDQVWSSCWSDTRPFDEIY
ncbi:Mitochondrial inner membrane protease atp23 [Puccinia graminis f. sp. tritici]|uniref:Mitochondrial inner membrane protease ATP23 n=1 Tax=Puccinia graminis f. sp. tritici TaxID=56615 RepID=A0A5B0PKC8_PUCGR|nr:Mitochondrial inner membrane protease atp23 [Puccinia graminis f. sp. tritici]